MSLVDPTPRIVGESGFAAGPLALGTWRLVDPDVAAAREVIETALEAGMNVVDTADVYGLDWGGSGFGAVESIIGDVLAATPDLRDRIVLVTKGGIDPPTPYDSSPDHLRKACEASLRRLRTDVIDVYLIHRPDMYSHPGEVAATLSSLRTEGKIREIGVSNHSPDQYDALARHLEFPVAVNQPEFSVTRLSPMRDGTLDGCMRDDVVPMAWSPLGGGAVVTGEGLTPELLATLDRLAGREGVDRATIAMAFVLAHPSRPVAIVGSQQPERIAAARRALDVYLDRNDCYDIIEASEGVPLP